MWKLINLSVSVLFLLLIVSNPAHAADVTLGVTQISAVRTSAAADGVFDNGWKWIFDVTVPTTETLLQMKFADWIGTSGTISTASNVRFYSAQSSDAFDSSHASTLAASGVYGDSIHLDSSKDLDLTRAGRQIQVAVETRVPTGSAGGSYSTSYGINTAVNPGVPIEDAVAATLTTSAASDNPGASHVAVSSSTTTGVKLASFTLRPSNQDVTVTAIPVTLTTNDDQLSDVISSVKLMRGDLVIKSKTVGTSSSETIIFDGITQSLAKDTNFNYSVVVDLKGDAAYADDTSLSATVPTSGWGVVDAIGNTIIPSSVVAGGTMTLSAVDMTIYKGVITSSVAVGLSGNGDVASFTIPFTVTAGDNDVFIAGSIARGSMNTTKVSFGTTTTSTSGVTGMPTANLSVSDVVTGDSAGSYYKVLAGTSRTFTVNVAITASTTGVTAGYVGIILNGIAYGNTSSLGKVYTYNLDTFKTNDVYVTKR